MLGIWEQASRKEGSTYTSSFISSMLDAGTSEE